MQAQIGARQPVGLITGQDPGPPRPALDLHDKRLPDRLLHFARSEIKADRSTERAQSVGNEQQDHPKRECGARQ